MKFFNVYYNVKKKDDIPETEVDQIYNVGIFKTTPKDIHKVIIRGTRNDEEFKSFPGTNFYVFLEEIFEELTNEEEYQITYHQNEEE